MSFVPPSSPLFHCHHLPPPSISSRRGVFPRASQEQTHDPPEARVRIVSRLVHPLLLGDLVRGVDETAWTGQLALHVALLVVCIVRPGVRGKSPGSDGLAAPIARSGVAGGGCGARESWLTPSWVSGVGMLWEELLVCWRERGGGEALLEASSRELSLHDERVGGSGWWSVLRVDSARVFGWLPRPALLFGSWSFHPGCAPPSASQLSALCLELKFGGSARTGFGDSWIVCESARERRSIRSTRFPLGELLMNSATKLYHSLMTSPTLTQHIGYPTQQGKLCTTSRWELLVHGPQSYYTWKIQAAKNPRLSPRRIL